jgi:hypothetical protein
MTDSVWIRREYFASKTVWKYYGQNLVNLILTTTFPHLFTPYPHYAVAGESESECLRRESHKY